LEACDQVQNGHLDAAFVFEVPLNSGYHSGSVNKNA